MHACVEDEDEQQSGEEMIACGVRESASSGSFTVVD